MKKISFIVPTLNRFNLINRLLEDFNRQINKNFEIIFIDQSKKINLFKINYHLLKKLNCKIFHIENQNASLARNFGIKKTQNDFIFLLDDDVRIFDSLFTQKLIYFSSFPSTKILSGSINKLKSHNNFKYKNLTKLSWIDFPLNIKINIKKYGLGRSCALGFEKFLIKKTGAMDVNFYKGAFREETEFLHRLSSLGYYTSYFHGLNIYHAEHKSGGIRADKKFLSDIKHCFGDLYFFIKSKKIISNLIFFKHFIFKHIFEKKKKFLFSPLKIFILFISLIILFKTLFYKKNIKINNSKKIF